MVDFPILPSSDKALAVKRQRNRYPFEQLNVGQSFAVPFDNSAYTSLKSLVSRKNKMTNGPQFRVIKHGDTIEVARIS